MKKKSQSFSLISAELGLCVFCTLLNSCNFITLLKLLLYNLGLIKVHKTCIFCDEKCTNSQWNALLKKTANFYYYFQMLFNKIDNFYLKISILLKETSTSTNYLSFTSFSSVKLNFECFKMKQLLGKNSTMKFKCKRSEGSNFHAQLSSLIPPLLISLETETIVERYMEKCREKKRLFSFLLLFKSQINIEGFCFLSSALCTPIY